MATVPYTCPSCGLSGAAQVGQSVYGRLRWWLSFTCPACGAALEGDGGEEAPDDVRAAILAEQGTWALIVEAKDASRMQAAAALRVLLGLSMAETSALKAKLPGRVAVGTKAEMEHLKLRLGEQGVQARVEQADLPPAAIAR